jgi:hypothetical protein
VAVSCIGGGNRNTLEKTTDMLQVTDKHNVVSSIRIQTVYLNNMAFIIGPGIVFRDI